MNTNLAATIQYLTSIALQEAKNGKVTPELKLLFNYPYRTHVLWSLFPINFRPSDPEDFGCHEG